MTSIGVSSHSSVEDTALIGRNHILDVDKIVFSTVHLEHLEGLLDEVSQVGCLALAVVDLVTNVLVADLEEVQHRKDLSIVGNEGLTNGVRAANEGL